MTDPTTTVASLLLLALCAHFIAPVGSVVISASCCMSYISKKIPESRVVSYQLSNASICPKAAVIFTTKKGQKFCGNPKQQWVQKYVKNLNTKQKTGSTGGLGQTGTTAPLQTRPTNSSI